MQDVAAGELLRTSSFHPVRICGVPRLHFFSANDASILSRQLLGGSIGVPIHVSDGLAITEESTQSPNEGSSCQKEVPHDMDREAVEGEENAEESRVNAKFKEI